MRRHRIRDGSRRTFRKGAPTILALIQVKVHERRRAHDPRRVNRSDQSSGKARRSARVRGWNDAAPGAAPGRRHPNTFPAGQPGPAIRAPSLSRIAVTRRKSRRLLRIASCGVVLASAVGLVLFAMSGSIVFFSSPSEIASRSAAAGTRLRLGGLVKEGSVRRGPDQHVAFAVTDTASTVQVEYHGLLPDLFREGQGVVAEGVLRPDGAFRADTILAKHDETYMPREVTGALKAQGHWQGGRSPSR